MCPNSMEDDELPSEDGMVGRGPLPPAQRCCCLLHLWGAHCQRRARSARERGQHALTSTSLVPQRWCPPATTSCMDMGADFLAAILAALPLSFFLHSGRPTSCGLLRTSCLPRTALQPTPPPGCTETGQSQGTAAHRYVRIRWMWCHLLRALNGLTWLSGWLKVACVLREQVSRPQQWLSGRNHCPANAANQQQRTDSAASAAKTLYSRKLLFSTHTHTLKHLNWQQPAGQLYKKYLIK